MRTASSNAEADRGRRRRPILAVNNIEVVYNHVILVLKGVSLTVPKGEIVALLGANGAGKTTTLKAISNLLQSERGEVTKGAIVFDGAEVQALTRSARASITSGASAGWLNGMSFLVRVPILGLSSFRGAPKARTRNPYSETGAMDSGQPSGACARMAQSADPGARLPG